MNKKIYIGGDHAAFDLREKIKEHLTSKNIEVVDCGNFSNESVDYPDYAYEVAKKVSADKDSIGIVACYSGNGVNIVANKVKGIRSALAINKEMAILAKEHNHVNVLALSSKFATVEENIDILESFFKAEKQNERHLKRVKKIISLEK